MVLFTAPSWCVPCQRLEPHWKKAVEVAGVNKVEAQFVVVNMGEAPEDTASHWATEEFNIKGVPQIKYITDNDAVDIKSRAVIPILKEVEALNHPLLEGDFSNG